MLTTTIDATRIDATATTIESTKPSNAMLTTTTIDATRIDATTDSNQPSQAMPC